MIHHGNGKVSFKSAHNKYLVAKPDGNITATQTAIGPWEIFHLITNPDGSLSFKTHHNNYVAAEPGGAVNAFRPTIGTWERFRLDAVFPSFIAGRCQ